MNPRIGNHIISLITQIYVFNSDSFCFGLEDEDWRPSLPLWSTPQGVCIICKIFNYRHYILQGINGIEMGFEAVSYIQNKFYSDFGPVSEQ